MFKIDDKVALQENIVRSGHDDPSIGTIEAVKNNKFLIKWQSRYNPTPSYTEHFAHELMLEQDAILKSVNLEEEFKQLENLIKSKMEIAGIAIHDSIKIAADHGFSLSDFYYGKKPLMDAIGDAGWSSSSLSC